MVGWLDEFLADVERRGLSPQTVLMYRHALEKIMSAYGLDLETCTRDSLVSAFDDFRQHHKVSYVVTHITVAKMALRHLKRRELADALIYPKRPDPGESVLRKILTEEDRRKLIEQAPTLQDRLIIELLDETGGRKGELYKLRIRDVQFENIDERQTAILQLSGKSGTRRRRVYTCVPDLRAQINNHPHHTNPDAMIFLSRRGKPFTIWMFYNYVRDLGRRILKRPIHPHMFRHTAATNDSRLFTDRELMKLYGWKTPLMVGIYSHLSMRDVDEKDLVLHGLKKKEEIMRPIMQIQKCKCGYENAPIALYCGDCGLVLAQTTSAEPTLEIAMKVLADRDLLEKALALAVKQESQS